MPPKKPVTPISPAEEPMFMTWEEGDKQARALAIARCNSGDNQPVTRSVGTSIFSDVGGPDISVRDGFSRTDYEEFRRGEAIPTKPKEIIRACMGAYNQVGIVRNVVDMMADFTTQGIGLYHPNEKIEQFFQEWFRRVRGGDRSERFVNLLFRTANVVVRRTTAKLTNKVEDEMRRAKSDADQDAEPTVKLGKREIPWSYRFINPLTLEILDDDLSLFVTGENSNLGISLPTGLVNKIKNPKNARQRELVQRIPDHIRQAVERGAKVIPLENEKLKTSYYKRDDWDAWAIPMIYPILADINLLKKMKLADLAALDGAISCIRVWKLGDIASRILPTPTAINKLANMLMNNVGGGVMDLVWGPEIDLLETSTEVYRFLGSTKYEPCLTQIYAGLGIPPTLTGAQQQGGGGFSNNFISLKTLTERLEYARGRLAEFWQDEIRLVQQAMGFRFPAKLVFDRMTLTDEAAEKQLLLNMWDRGLVSDEVVVERFGETPEIEEVRIRRDERKRKNGTKPLKASPYHDPQTDYGYKKIFAQLGAVTPSQLGVELDDNAKGEMPVLDKQLEQADKTAKLTTQDKQAERDHQYRTERLQIKHGVHPNQIENTLNKTKVGSPGRPKQAKDKHKRKEKEIKPRTSASYLKTLAWTNDAQDKISTITSSAYLKSLGKKNLRQLTEDESATFEQYKFFLLCNLRPDSEVTEQEIVGLSKANLQAPAPIHELLKATLALHTEKHGKEPTLDDYRLYQAGAVAAWNTDVA